MNYKGVFTAMITPFRRNEVDYQALEALIEEQISAGVAGLVPVGTTGESPTLEMNEHIRVIEFVCRTVNKRVKVIAGTGGNSTAEAIELSVQAQKAGADATLLVTPYYNKPTQEGIVRHMCAIAEKSELPVVLYNIPGRCVTSIELPTMVRLNESLPLAAIKEASGSVERVSKLHQMLPGIPVLSGDDGLTLPMMSVGAVGVVSVASNLIPVEMTEMVDAMLSGRLLEARAIHEKFYALFTNLFIETNPIPVKAALAMRGIIEESYRLPLCEMAPANREILRSTLSHLGLLN